MTDEEATKTIEAFGAAVKDFDIAEDDSDG